MENIEVLMDYASGEMTLNEMNELFNDEYYQKRKTVKEYTDAFNKKDFVTVRHCLLAMTAGTTLGPLFFKDLVDKLNKDFPVKGRPLEYGFLYRSVMHHHVNIQLYNLSEELGSPLLDWTKIIERYLGIDYSEQCKYFGLFGEGINYLEAKRGITLNYGKKHIIAHCVIDDCNTPFLTAILLLRYIKKYNMEKIIEQNQDNELFMSMLNGFNQLRLKLDDFFLSYESVKKVHELYDNK